MRGVIGFLNQLKSFMFGVRQSKASKAQIVPKIGCSYGEEYFVLAP